MTHVCASNMEVLHNIAIRYASNTAAVETRVSGGDNCARPLCFQH